MEKKIIYTIACAIGVLGFFSSCEKFLEETPNKSNSAYIYHMDQLYGMMGSLDLYLLSSSGSGSIDYGFTDYFMSEQIYMSDAIEYDPNFWYIGMNRASANTYDLYRLDKNQFLSSSLMGNTWTPVWNRIYTFNTVLENLDRVQQTTQNIRKQVEGEALFGRAYYHFMLLTQFALWNENELGIGYRDNTIPNDIPSRETVAYTLQRIYDDLDKAEEVLISAGRTEFDTKRNYRPSVPTVHAFRARVNLYRGKYQEALSDANNALAAYNTLVDFKNDPLYALTPIGVYSFLNESNSGVTESRFMNFPYTMLMTQPGGKIIAEFKEMYLPNFTTTGYHPISKRHYNLFDKINDARWIHYYNGGYHLFNATGLLKTRAVNGQPTSQTISWEDQQWLEPQSLHSYFRFYAGGVPTDAIGMSTAEMYLIKAECLARNGSTEEAAEVLKALRKTRFVNTTSANNIGGSLNEVLDERSREMGIIWRFFDIKRLNGADNAGIIVTKKVLSDPSNINSVVNLVIQPNDGRWALPIYPVEVTNMNWEQNKGWE